MPGICRPPAAPAPPRSVPIAPSMNSCMSGGDMRDEGDDARSSSRPSHSGASGRASAVMMIMNLLRPISPMLCVPFATGPSATIVSKMGEASHATMWW